MREVLCVSALMEDGWVEKGPEYKYTVHHLRRGTVGWVELQGNGEAEGNAFKNSGYIARGWGICERDGIRI